MELYFLWIVPIYASKSKYNEMNEKVIGSSCNNLVR